MFKITFTKQLPHHFPVKATLVKMVARALNKAMDTFVSVQTGLPGSNVKQRYVSHTCTFNDQEGQIGKYLAQSFDRQISYPFV